ncbi:MAG: glucose 1-dehydrogenase [Anaerolineales bacterium]
MTKNAFLSDQPSGAPPVPNMSDFLAGQTALITGASSGIGRAVALSMAEAGADVLINWHSDEATAKTVVEKCQAFGVRAVHHQADISDEDQVLAMFSRVKEEWGAFDILVNNAGIQRDEELVEMKLEDWQKVIDVNLTGHFICTREAVKEFKGQGVREKVSSAAGKIIFISSVHELIPWAGRVNYAASKGGIMQLMKSTAQEVARHRIRVNSIAPGAIKTDINREQWETSEARQDLLELIPYDRIGEGEDVGRVAAWLASDFADYITGTTIFVDGGMSLYPSFSSGG